MMEFIKKNKKTILFTLIGVLVGYLYYRFISCSSAACRLTSKPWLTMLYTGFIGWFLSGSCLGGCSNGKCKM